MVVGVSRQNSEWRRSGGDAQRWRPGGYRDPAVAISGEVDGSTYDLTDPRLADELGAGVRIMRLDRGLFDAMPLSLITTATASALCGLAGVPANELRFRPNIVITSATGAPYGEDTWVGSTLRIGGVAVRVDRRDSRCVTVNVNPGTGQPDGPVLKVIGQYRRTYAGVYGTTVAPGRLEVGDEVTIGP
jgi:uncharacterized protein